MAVVAMRTDALLTVLPSRRRGGGEGGEITPTTPPPNGTPRASLNNNNNRPMRDHTCPAIRNQLLRQS